MSATILILASDSPRRAELLTAAGIPFEVRPAHIDERLHRGERPEGYVRRMAEAKARAIAGNVSGRAVLGADTVVVVGDQILGKPQDASDATRMLRLLSGRVHQVLTGVCLLAPAEGGHNGPAEAGDHGPAEAGDHGPAEAGHYGWAEAGHYGADTRLASTEVEFAALNTDEIRWYVASGEPADKAGAYAIQGRASRFVTRIDGSYSNVVGLPVALVYEMCTRAGMLLS